MRQGSRPGAPDDRSPQAPGLQPPSPKAAFADGSGMGRLHGPLEGRKSSHPSRVPWSRPERERSGACRTGRCRAERRNVAAGLTDHVWSMSEYVRHPVHPNPYKEEEFQERVKELMECPLDPRKRAAG